jgi:hypothetical protein
MPNDKKRADEHLDVGLRDSFPASDPPASTVPAAENIIPPDPGLPPRPREDMQLTDRSLSQAEDAALSPSRPRSDPKPPAASQDTALVSLALAAGLGFIVARIMKGF